MSYKCDDSIIFTFHCIFFLGNSNNKDVSHSSDHSHCFHILVQSLCIIFTALSPDIFNTSDGISSYPGFLLFLRLFTLKFQIKGGILIDRGSENVPKFNILPPLLLY